MRHVLCVFILFTIVAFSPGAQPTVTVDYYAYIPPGVSSVNNVYNSFEAEQLDAVLMEVETRTGIKIIPNFQKERTKDAIYKTLTDKLFDDTNPLELVTHPLNDGFQNLLNQNFFLEVDSLIRKYAPSIYSSFPKHFWANRKTSGETYGIPVKRYSHFTDYGFWVIKKDVLKTFNVPGDITGEYLFEIIKSCSIESNPILFPTKNPYDVISKLLKIVGYPLFDHNEFYYDDIGYRIKILQDEEWVSENIETMNRIGRTVKSGRSYVNALLYETWSVAFIPLDAPWTGIREIEKNKLMELFDSCAIVSDMDIIPHSPLDEYDYLYIPANSSQAIVTVQMLELFYKEKYWYDLFTYGTGNSFTGLPGVTRNGGYDYYFLSLGNHRKPLQLLCNNKNFRIPDFYPRKIKDDVKRFIAEEEILMQNHPLYGFDPERISDRYTRSAIPRNGTDNYGIIALLSNSPDVTVPMHPDFEKKFSSVSRFFENPMLNERKQNLQNEARAYAK